MMAAAEDVHDEYREAIDTARRIRSLRAGGYKLDVKPNPLDTVIEPTQQVRTTAALLHLDAVLAAADGDADRGVSDAHAILNAACSVGDEPFLISMLVRVACSIIAKEAAERVVALAEPVAGLPELQAGFLAEAGEPLLAVALRGERAVMDRLFENFDAGVFDRWKLAGGRPPFNPFADFGWWLYRGKQPADRATYLRWTTDMLAVCRRPMHERRQRFTAVPLPVLAEAPLTRLLLPAVEKVGEADHRVKALLRSAAVGIACERFRQANDRWPKELAEIPKDILPSIPIDPYDGQPLRCRGTPDGAVVYSVGPDLTDDGGHLSYGQPRPGDDIGFRL